MRDRRTVSDLDVESKLTFHYQAPWTPQRNFFLPSTRPACLEELHHRAHDQTPSLQIDHQQRRTLSRERRVTICVSVAPPTGDYPSPHSPLRGKHRARSVSTFDTHPSPTDCCHFSPWSRKVVWAARPSDTASWSFWAKGPGSPVLNAPSTWTGRPKLVQRLPSLHHPPEGMKSDLPSRESLNAPAAVVLRRASETPAQGDGVPHLSPRGSSRCVAPGGLPVWVLLEVSGVGAPG
ncbi:unnamed protein product, partial [Gadus morhua 'NCC']